MRFRVAALLLGLATSGCGLATPSVNPVPERTQPPEVSINGVAGAPATCGDVPCASGIPLTPEEMPSVSGPGFQVQLPAEARISEVTLWEEAGSTPRITGVPFDDDSFEDVPESAYMASVLVQFSGGENALYYWSLEQ